MKKGKRKRDTQNAKRATKGHVCRRCGRCCQDLGRSFWVHSEHELVSAMAARLGDGFYTDTGACDMLKVAASGRATCLLQKWLGHRGKPKACREYPFNGEKCFAEQTEG